METTTDNRKGILVEYNNKQLQIATQFMAAHITGCVYAGFPYKRDEVAAEALKDAKALIDAYNSQNL